MPTPNEIRIAFFGTPEFAVTILDELKKGGVIPRLLITKSDEPKGRKLLITPPPVKIWADLQGIRVIQPANLTAAPEELLQPFDLFIVAAYGKMIPDNIINTPKYGTINVHPSLLPKYRGASPVQSAILNGDSETGVSIMLLDKEMDHGPVIAQEKLGLYDKPHLPELKEKLAKMAAQMLIKVIPGWIAGEIKAMPQDHTQATFTKKVGQEDGFVPSSELLDQNLSIESANKIEQMVRALTPDPGVFTYFNIRDRKVRVKVTRARVDSGKLVIERVIPEGKKEMSWEDFKRGNKI